MSAREAQTADARAREVDDRRPRVLGVRFGANPNSSSLGVDVTFLLLGGAGALAVALATAAYLRARAALEARRAERAKEEAP